MFKQERDDFGQMRMCCRFATWQNHLITRTVGRNKMSNDRLCLFEGAKDLLVFFSSMKAIRASEIAMRSDIPINEKRQSLEALGRALPDDGLFFSQLIMSTPMAKFLTPFFYFFLQWLCQGNLGNKSSNCLIHIVNVYSTFFTSLTK